MTRSIREIITSQNKGVMVQTEPLQFWTVFLPEKKSSVLLFSVNAPGLKLKRVRCFWLCKYLLLFLFVINKLRFSENALSSRNGLFDSNKRESSINIPSSKKFSYNSKWKNLILNPSKSFLALKKVNPRILRTFERSFSRNKNRKSAEVTHYPLARRWI